LEDVALPVPLGSAVRKFEELLAAQSSNVQPVVRDLFPELFQDVSTHQQVQQHPVMATMTTDVIQCGVGAEVQQAEKQRQDTGCPQLVQQAGSEGIGSFGPTETTPVLSIHAVSDVESDGGEVCRASSSVTVHAVAKGKVTAEASVKPSGATSKLPGLFVALLPRVRVTDEGSATLHDSIVQSLLEENNQGTRLTTFHAATRLHTRLVQKNIDSFKTTFATLAVFVIENKLLAVLCHMCNVFLFFWNCRGRQSGGSR